MGATTEPTFFSAYREQQPDGIRVRLTGELDVAAIPALRAEFDQISETPAPSITIDVSELSFLDLSGMRALFEAFDSRPWPTASLVGVSGSVSRLIALVPTLRPSSPAAAIRLIGLDLVAVPMTA